jgi:hypothetical protein
VSILYGKVVRDVGNQGKGKGAWGGSVKGTQARAKSAARTTPKPAKKVNVHGDGVKSNRNPKRK